MNTTKIFDVVPQGTPVPAHAQATPSRPPPQAVPSLGDGAASDALRKHAERQAEAAAAEAERKRARPEPRQYNFNREVGRVGDTFEVFVDLVSPALNSHRFRIFGPPENPAPPPPVPTSDPASAHAAYTGGGTRPPVLKTDV